MSEIQSWSATAGSNNSAVPDGWPEGMAPSGFNNCGREMMAALAKWYKDGNGSLTSGGSSDAYTLSPNRTIAAYAAGVDFLWIANHTNAGAATLNVSSLGAKSIRDRDGTALTAGDIQSGAVIHTVYDNSNGYFRATNIKVSSSTNPAIDDLSDVAISTATSGDLLVFNGTSWVNSSQGAKSLSDTGYITLPGGLVIQWGSGSVGSLSIDNKSFPVAFPTKCVHISMQAREANFDALQPLKLGSSPASSNTAADIRNPNSETVNYHYIAVGY